MVLQFSATHSFSIAQDGSRRRLIVIKDGEELVCRKESLSKLHSFLSSDSGQLFKGRLQLIKTKSGVGLQVKGEMIGEIRDEQFRQLLQSSSGL